MLKIVAEKFNIAHIYLLKIVLFTSSVVDGSNGASVIEIITLVFNVEMSVTVSTTSAAGAVTSVCTTSVAGAVTVAFCPSVGCLARTLGALVSLKTWKIAV